MILGTGNDLVDIRRIERALVRFGPRFVARCFTAEEQALAESRTGLRAASYAKRFAAKEACAKALGTGIAGGVFLRDIGVIHDGAGRPGLCLRGGALARLNTLTPPGQTARIHLSLTDEPPMAAAHVIIESV